MKKDYEKRMVYRVWYGPKFENEAFFTDITAAQIFAMKINAPLNKYKWKMLIER